MVQFNYLSNDNISAGSHLSDLLNNTINITLGARLPHKHRKLLLLIVLRQINLLVRTAAGMDCYGLQGSLGIPGLGSALPELLPMMVEYLRTYTALLSGNL